MAERAPSTPERDQSAIQHNVRAMAEIEEKTLGARSIAEHIGDLAARGIGSLPFVLFHFVWFTSWIAINLGKVPGIRPFDRFPFSLLALMVSLEAIFLSLFLLINQNRMTRQAEKRAHLALQVNLLAEAESTRILGLLNRIADHMGVVAENREPQGTDLEQPTDIQGLASEVERSIPDTS